MSIQYFEASTLEPGRALGEVSVSCFSAMFSSPLDLIHIDSEVRLGDFLINFRSLEMFRVQARFRMAPDGFGVH